MAGIVLLRGVLQEFIEIRPKFFETFIALERFVITKERKDDIRLDFFQPVIGGAEVFGAMPRDDFIAGEKAALKSIFTG